MKRYLASLSTAYIALYLPGGLNLPEPRGLGQGTGNFRSVGGLISSFLPYLFITGGLIMLVMLLLGGFEVMTSVGNEEKMKGGTERIKNALTGFILLFATFWLTQIIQVLFKIQIL